MNNTAFRAQLIASLMQVNCDAYDAGGKTRAEWSAEQTRLWNQSSKWLVASEVMALVCPRLTNRVPPYAVLKQLMEDTQKVGRS